MNTEIRHRGAVPCLFFGWLTDCVCVCVCVCYANQAADEKRRLMNIQRRGQRPRLRLGSNLVSDSRSDPLVFFFSFLHWFVCDFSWNGRKKQNSSRLERRTCARGNTGSVAEHQKKKKKKERNDKKKRRKKSRWISCCSRRCGSTPSSEQNVQFKTDRPESSRRLERRLDLNLGLRKKEMKKRKPKKAKQKKKTPRETKRNKPAPHLPINPHLCFFLTAANRRCRAWEVDRAPRIGRSNE